MKIPLRVSGLIMIAAGLLFLISACVANAAYLWFAAVICIICGLLWMLPRHMVKSAMNRRPAFRGGKYSK